MKDIQSSIQSLLNQLVADGKERGVQAAAYLDGKLVVNASAGIADVRTQKPVTNETLFPVFSTTKGIAATLLHLLVERGQITYDTRIADCWPEFAAHGKGEITLRHALSHTSGVPHMPTGIGHKELCDWETMAAAIADLKPLTAPGEEFAYHAITYSWTIGEVIRRVDGRSFQKILEDEICKPLSLSNLYVGIPAEVEVAFLESEPAESAPEPMPHNAAPQAIPPLVQPLHEWMNRSDAQHACLPASSGISNAHDIARHYAALLPGGVEGVELLPPERIRLATEIHLPKNKPAQDANKNRALGYIVETLPTMTRFGHGGYGGSIGFASLKHRLAFGFTRNRFTQENSLQSVVDEVQKIAGLS